MKSKENENVEIKGDIAIQTTTITKEWSLEELKQQKSNIIAQKEQLLNKANQLMSIGLQMDTAGVKKKLDVDEIELAKKLDIIANFNQYQKTINESNTIKIEISRIDKVLKTLEKNINKLENPEKTKSFEKPKEE